MILKSKIHTIAYTRPVFLWFFVNFIAACICSPTAEHDTFRSELFFTFLFYSSIGIALLAIIIILNKKVLIIDEEKIIYRNNFLKQQKEFKLDEIIDFNWHSKPTVIDPKFVFPIRLNNEHFEITFKDDRELSISYDQYSNFYEIRSFFYDYCIKHGIIEMRPLEERRHSRMKR